MFPAIPKAFDDLSSALAEKLSSSGEEDVLPVIAAKGDAVERGGYVNAKLSWHPCLERWNES